MRAVAVIVSLLIPGAVEARTHTGPQTRLFTDVVIGPQQTIDGDLNVIFGDVVIDGTVRGDVNALGGSCSLGENALITGRVHCVWSGVSDLLAPWATRAPSLDEARREHGDARRFFVRLAGDAIVLVAFALFPRRLRLAVARVERHPGFAALFGFLAFATCVPLGALLIVSVVGIPLVALEAAALLLGIWIGHGAIALLVGQRLVAIAAPHTVLPPIAAILSGLIVLSAAELVPLAGWAITAIVWIIGLGATILTFVHGSAFPSEHSVET